jgi:acyl carrier protein
MKINARELIIDILLKKNIIKDASKIRDDMTLEDLDIDSLDLLDVIFEAEGIIQLKVPFDDAKSVTTFQDIVDLVQGLVDNPPPQNPNYINIEGQPKFADVVKELAEKEKNG